MIHAPKVAHLEFVPVAPLSTALFTQVLDRTRYAELAAAIVRTRERLEGRVVWNVTTQARVGGVPELLRSVVAYALGAGIDARWLTVQGQPELHRITKRVHNHLHGVAGDGGELGEPEHEEYERRLAPVAFELSGLVRRSDIVVLHDPPTAGLVPELKQTGAKVVWRSHFGLEHNNRLAHGAWAFLMRYLGDADAYVLPRAKAVPKDLPPERVRVIAPSIDPLSPKNNVMTRAEAAAVLISAGMMSGYSAAPPMYVHPSGTIGLVSRRAEVVQLEALQPWSRVVVQVSRWDRLKDPIGVMHAFAGLVPPRTQSHLMLAGPDIIAAGDDPEGADVLHRTIGAWEGLPEHARRRVHIAILPMRDPDENAATVNALERWSEVVVQKSLAEGVGLTVTESMWKARPVVASRVGGIEDQVEHEKSGLLVDDPTDLAAFAGAVTRLLERPDEARAMGRAATERVAERYLLDRQLEEYGDLLGRVVA